jgi:transposase
MKSDRMPSRPFEQIRFLDLRYLALCRVRPAQADLSTSPLVPNAEKPFRVGRRPFRAARPGATENKGRGPRRVYRYRALPDKLQKDVLKGTRWLLLMNSENLDPAKGEPRRLEKALELNVPLATAYYMKELLRYFWEQPSKPAARRWLDEWIWLAGRSGIAMLQKFAKTLAAHRTGLLSWYSYPISTGPLEAPNTKIQLLKRQAYGYRDQEFFHLKIYALHLTKYALVG